MGFSITNVVRVPFTSNISQKYLTFYLEIFKSRSWYFSRNFKYLFHFLLIGPTTPRKFFCQGVDPSVCKFNTEKRETKGFIAESSGRGLPSPKFVASVELSFFLISMKVKHYVIYVLTCSDKEILKCGAI